MEIRVEGHNGWAGTSWRRRKSTLPKNGRATSKRCVCCVLCAVCCVLCAVCCVLCAFTFSIHVCVYTCVCVRARACVRVRVRVCVRVRARACV